MLLYLADLKVEKERHLKQLILQFDYLHSHYLKLGIGFSNLCLWYINDQYLISLTVAFITIEYTSVTCEISALLSLFGL